MEEPTRRDDRLEGMRWSSKSLRAAGLRCDTMLFPGLEGFSVGDDCVDWSGGVRGREEWFSLRILELDLEHADRRLCASLSLGDFPAF